MPSLGGWEWVILIVVAALLFGGSRLAGIGKNAGKAIREFKEEVSTPISNGLKDPEPTDPPVSQYEYGTTEPNGVEPPPANGQA
jgi:sec-independent protein translocase protein TatA